MPAQPRHDPPLNHRQPRPQGLTPHPVPKMGSRTKTKVSFRVAWSRHGSPPSRSQKQEEMAAPLGGESSLLSPSRGALHWTQTPPTKALQLQAPTFRSFTATEDLGASTAPNPRSTSPPTQFASPRARPGVSDIDTVLAAGGNVTTQTNHPTNSTLTAGGGESLSRSKSTATDRAFQLLTDTITFRHKQLQYHFLRRIRLLLTGNQCR